MCTKRTCQNHMLKQGTARRVGRPGRLPPALEASVTEQPVQSPSFYTPEDVVAAKIRDIAAARAASAQPEHGEPSGSASPAYASFG